MRSCFVHSGRQNIVTGFIEKVYLKRMDVRLYIDDEEYVAVCEKSSVVYKQQPQIKEGRYIGMNRMNPGKIHLCTCKWSKEDIEKVNRQGERLAELLKQAEHKPIAD